MPNGTESTSNNVLFKASIESCKSTVIEYFTVSAAYIIYNPLNNTKRPSNDSPTKHIGIKSRVTRMKVACPYAPITGSLLPTSYDKNDGESWIPN